MKKRNSLLVVFLILSMFLTGCYGYPIVDAGQKVLSEEEAEKAYNKIDQQLEALLAQPCAYSVELSSIGSKICYYNTEEYQVAFAEIGPFYEKQEGGKYLWYHDVLYRYDSYVPEGEEMHRSWVETSWEQMQAQEFVNASIDFGRSLLSEKADLEYTEFLANKDNHYRLIADYPLTAVELETREVYPHIYAWWNEKHELSGFTVRWSRPNRNSDGDLVVVTLWRYEDSTDYQAERKVWIVGHDLELCETPVPALTRQEKDRGWCKKMIGSMDFSTLQTPETQDKNLKLMSSYPEVWID